MYQCLHSQIFEPPRIEIASPKIPDQLCCSSVFQRPAYLPIHALGLMNEDEKDLGTERQVELTQVADSNVLQEGQIGN